MIDKRDRLYYYYNRKDTRDRHTPELPFLIFCRPTMYAIQPNQQDGRSVKFLATNPPTNITSGNIGGITAKSLSRCPNKGI